jgi:hypothetical protein
MQQIFKQIVVGKFEVVGMKSNNLCMRLAGHTGLMTNPCEYVPAMNQPSHTVGNLATSESHTRRLGYGRYGGVGYSKSSSLRLTFLTVYT